MLRVWGLEEVALPSIVEPRLFLSPDNRMDELVFIGDSGCALGWMIGSAELEVQATRMATAPTAANHQPAGKSRLHISRQI